jgi:predicted DNA-binding transcriptional regulator AlpA
LRVDLLVALATGHEKILRLVTPAAVSLKFVGWPRYRNDVNAPFPGLHFAVKIKTGEVVAHTGLSRQTVSRLAAQGYIPGAKRMSSGRWTFTHSQALHDWMAQEGRITRIRRRRQVLHQDEAEIRQLERKAAKLRVSAGSRRAKQRLLELTNAIAHKRATIVDHLTVRELAKATRRSRRWVTGRARSIPGARMLRNKFVFEKSDALSEWIHRERRLRDLERRLLPGDMRFPRSRMAWVLLDTWKYERGVLREINQVPFAKWPKDEQHAFAKYFRHMVREIQRGTAITLEE